MRNISCVILAAGQGTRMKSEIPKVLFDICGKTMIEHLLETVKELDFSKIYIVVGYKADFKTKDAMIFGLPDGSVLIKSASGKRLWEWR
jgi:bifunctional N-acetylglucosamine-1-phosphate-uridyltransferase/glucosamine-1-phosphate-acetyltransferase GlmU-like protein